jgi:protein-L-isoaspartate(D-aspartate) O-methyltransferase
MFEKRRNEMVTKYVIEAGIRNSRIIDAMRKIPRHLFVEYAIEHQAYSGASLPIGYGQTISHPRTVALMTAALDLNGEEKILEIGTGSGYQAAVLTEMGVKVFSIERIPQLSKKAQELLYRLGYFSVAFHIGDGSVGWTQYAPFDRIMVTAGSPKIPKTLLNQLTNNGRLIIPVGSQNTQEFVLVIRQGEKFVRKILNKATFVPLIGRKGWENKK